MEFCIDAEQLRKALAEIEAAEKNGFMHCLAVFYMSNAGRGIDQCRANYSDLLERAHPYDGNLNWGRYQRVSQRAKFVDGELQFIPAPQPQNGST